ncbi:MAG: imidazoleglycerol-phosphate dehydratase [Desulfitibacter sp. BRH_c19]|nr:MAG: imidazoleglycerol-phosphate dehydratase [Desulfitibacter sp. BRH_c19]
MRKGCIERVTGETNIKIKTCIEGNGIFTGTSGIGFFDHMLELFAKHSGCDLDVEASGDIHVDYHHLVEDLGICIGKSIKEALADKKGIKRYGMSYVPMDEALIRVVVDFSGRPYLAYRVHDIKDRVGVFDTELVEEFLRALTLNGGITIHVDKISGHNTHHIIEGIFKALARSMSAGWQLDANPDSVLSTKGILE